jgi:hypothetical protein
MEPNSRLIAPVERSQKFHGSIFLILRYASPSRAPPGLPPSTLGYSFGSGRNRQ